MFYTTSFTQERLRWYLDLYRLDKVNVNYLQNSLHVANIRFKLSNYQRRENMGEAKVVMIMNVYKWNASKI